MPAAALFRLQFGMRAVHLLGNRILLCKYGFFLLFINIYIFKSEIYIKKRTFILSRIFKLILSVKSNFLIVHPQSSLSFSFYFLFFSFSQWMDNVKKGTKKRGAWTLKFWKRCTYTYIIMFILNFPQNPKLICPAENKQN